MMPAHARDRGLFCLARVLLAAVPWVLGCNSLDLRSKKPEEDATEQAAESVKLVGDLAVPFGMNAIRIESVALVTGLPNTGSDPPPTPQRSALLAEMQTLGVRSPQQVLASPTTEMVLVRGYLRPGIQKGDKFDVEVRMPARSEGTSLRGGWLMKTRLKELAVLGGQVQDGKLLGTAEGAILVDPSATDKASLGYGRVLGGGVSVTSRELGLVLKPDSKNVLASATIGSAVNRRFHTFDAGMQQGVAEPKTDEFVVLKVHPRYKDNVERYIRVVRAIPLRENAEQGAARLKVLERELLSPATAAKAAVQLEAIGKEGIDTLKRGLVSHDPEVRFFAAEALAYLDEASAAAPLGELARDVPAFRAYALAALSAMDDFAAFEALRDLLLVPSAETRYGAFRSLWAMNARDPLVRGESLNDKFSYHLLAVDGPPMIHVTRSFRPEIVIFGHEQQFATPLVLEAGKQIMVKSLDGERVSVSRFAVDEPDQKRVVSTRVDDVIRAIVELGGDYPDVVQALQQAKSAGALAGRFEMDALPQGGRSYARKSDATSDEPSEPEPEVIVGNPLPDLFSRRAPGGAEKRERTSEDEKKSSATEEKPGVWKSIFGKLADRD